MTQDINRKGTHMFIAMLCTVPADSVHAASQKGVDLLLNRASLVHSMPVELLSTALERAVRLGPYAQHAQKAAPAEAVLAAQSGGLLHERLTQATPAGIAQNNRRKHRVKGPPNGEPSWTRPSNAVIERTKCQSATLH